MKHGRKLAHLPGPNKGAKSRHLRNLVGALLHHESITTTLARAKYTARMAEKMISKGKRGTNGQAMKAMAFLLPPHHHNPDHLKSLHPHKRPPTAVFGYPEIPDPYKAYRTKDFEPPKSLMSKVFMTLAERYKDREGGYTRILKAGRRSSDKAKMAVVCLVDGPRDLRFEMLAREVGTQALQNTESEAGVLEGTSDDWMPSLHENTQKELKQVLRLRSAEDKLVFEEKARRHADEVLAKEQTANGLWRPNPALRAVPLRDRAKSGKPLMVGYKPRAGERLSGLSTAHTGLGIARGILGGPGQVMGRFRRPQAQVLEQKFLVKAGSAKMASIDS